MNPTEAYRAASADPVSAGSGPDDPRVLRAVEEYLAALEAGFAPGRAEFLGRHAAIAARLGISDQTVKFHVSSICSKLPAANRTEAVRRAIRRGLITV